MNTKHLVEFGLFHATATFLAVLMSILWLNPHNSDATKPAPEPSNILVTFRSFVCPPAQHEQFLSALSGTGCYDHINGTQGFDQTYVTRTQAIQLRPELIDTPMSNEVTYYIGGGKDPLLLFSEDEARKYHRPIEPSPFESHPYSGRPSS